MAKKRKRQYVFLVQDDRDVTDEGVQIGIGIYPASRPVITEDEQDHIMLMADVIERIFGPSEDAAWHNAMLRVQGAGWRIAKVGD